MSKTMENMEDFYGQIHAAIIWKSLLKKDMEKYMVSMLDGDTHFHDMQ